MLYRPRWIAALLCLACLGCGPSGPPMTKVSGTVTMNGAPPPQSGRVIFTPIAAVGDQPLPSRPVNAPFGVDGKYVATTHEPGDGLPPGRYSVRVHCYDVPGPAIGSIPESLVREDWRPEELEVTGEQRSLELNYDAPLKKKRR